MTDTKIVYKMHKEIADWRNKCGELLKISEDRDIEIDQLRKDVSNIHSVGRKLEQKICGLRSLSSRQDMDIKRLKSLVRFLAHKCSHKIKAGYKVRCGLYNKPFDIEQCLCFCNVLDYMSEEAKSEYFHSGLINKESKQ